MSRQSSDRLATEKPLVVVMTGLSGAGRSVAVHALEDLGFYSIGHLPAFMLRSTLSFIQKSPNRHFVLTPDVRDRDFSKQFPRFKKELQKIAEVDHIFLTADEDVIVNRYRATRRKHPGLAAGGEIAIAVRQEKQQFEDLQQQADIVFNTSETSPHQLARLLEQRYARGITQRQLYVTVVSFGFKYGIYRSADSLFDVRFLTNPYFVDALKNKTGLDQLVQQYVEKDERFEKLLSYLVELHDFLLPQYLAEGKHYYRIGIGCTGGQHRSVVVAEKLTEKLAQLDTSRLLVSVYHRDLDVMLPALQ